LRGGETCVECEIVDGRRVDELHFVAPRFDRRLSAVVGPDQQPVEQDMVVGSVDSGDDGGVVWPGHSGINWPHGSGGYALAGQLAESWDRQARIVQRIGGKAVETDNDDGVLFLRLGSGR